MSAQQRLESLQQVVGVLQNTVAEATQEIANLRANATSVSDQVGALRDASRDSWDRVNKRIDAMEAEARELRVRQGGGGADHSKWNLDNKGTLKEFS